MHSRLCSFSRLHAVAPSRWSSLLFSPRWCFSPSASTSNVLCIGSMSLRRAQALIVSVFFLSQASRLTRLHPRRSLATQQYFDSYGMFITIVFSLPILFNCSVLVCLWLYQTFSLMRQVARKRVELRSRKKNDGDSADKAGDVNDDSVSPAEAPAATRRSAAKKKKASQE
eukprot:m.3638 g.3638  ORF g.3638 m.3638 type:complete len:170 (-) comp2334_c0_seq1:100-609(-)